MTIFLLLIILVLLCYLMKTVTHGEKEKQTVKDLSLIHILVWFILFALMQGIAFLLEKRRAYKLSLRYILGGCILFTALFVYIGYRQAAPLVLRSYSVTAKMNIVKDLQFYLLSDLHLGSGVDKQLSLIHISCHSYRC